MAKLDNVREAPRTYIGVGRGHTWTITKEGKFWVARTPGIPDHAIQAYTLSLISQTLKLGSA